MQNKPICGAFQFEERTKTNPQRLKDAPRIDKRSGEGLHSANVEVNATQRIFQPKENAKQ